MILFKRENFNTYMISKSCLDERLEIPLGFAFQPSEKRLHSTRAAIHRSPFSEGSFETC